MRLIVWMLGAAALATLGGASTEAQEPPGSRPPVTCGALSELLQTHGRDAASVLQPAEEAADERVCVSRAGLEPARLKLGLANLLRYSWEREGATRVFLRSNLRIQRLETSLWQRTLEAGAQPLLQLVRYAAQGKAGLDAAAQDRRVSDVNLNLLKNPESQNALRLLGSLSSAQLVDLLDMEKYLLPWARMSSTQQDLARKLMLDPSRFDPVKDRAWLEQFGLVLNTPAHPISGSPESYGVGVGGPFGVYAVFPPGTTPEPILPVRGNPYRALDPAPRPEVFSLAARPFPQDIRLDPKVAWPDVLTTLAPVCGLPLFSDDYPAADLDAVRAGTPALPTGQRTLGAVLDALCRQHVKLWWEEDGMLFFRSRAWFIHRQYQVPAATLKRLREQIVKQGKLGTAEVTLLARLKPRQLEGLMTTSEATQGGIHRERHDRHGPRESFYYLQVWQLMNEVERIRALSPEGLPLLTMYQPRAQQAFREMLVVHRGRGTLDDPKGVRYRVQQNVVPAPAPRRPALLRLAFTWRDRVAVHARLAIAFPPPDEADPKQPR